MTPENPFKHHLCKHPCLAPETFSSAKNIGFRCKRDRYAPLKVLAVSQSALRGLSENLPGFIRELFLQENPAAYNIKGAPSPPLGSLQSSPCRTHMPPEAAVVAWISCMKGKLDCMTRVLLIMLCCSILMVLPVHQILLTHIDRRSW